jgi:ubiquinone/menaquinone biosynthesis C-methylase UbiE
MNYEPKGMNLQNLFGNIDIYVFDQILKGRYAHCKKILDAGCGSGRNIVYFLQQPQHEVYGVDISQEAIDHVRSLAAEISPHTPADHFQPARVEELPFKDASFDLVICNTVLHFARDTDHFDQMMRSMWRVLKPGGYFFSRLASNIGTEELVKPLGGRRYLLGDGTERFLVDQNFLLSYTEQLNGTLYERIKTTVVQDLRSMTTWCVQK